MPGAPCCQWWAVAAEITYEGLTVSVLRPSTPSASEGMRRSCGLDDPGISMAGGVSGSCSVSEQGARRCVHTMARTSRPKGEGEGSTGSGKASDSAGSRAEDTGSTLFGADGGASSQAEGGPPS